MWTTRQFYSSLRKKLRRDCCQAERTAATQIELLAGYHKQVDGAPNQLPIQAIEVPPRRLNLAPAHLRTASHLLSPPAQQLTFSAHKPKSPRTPLEGKFQEGA